MSLSFRWFGTAGLSFQVEGQVLAIDPFFTRPSILQMIKPIISNPHLVEKYLPACYAVLLTHSHYDHLLDAPAVLSSTGAIAYGSANSCQLLRLHSIAENQVKEVHVGDRLTLGAFEVQVVRGHHSPIPFGRVFNSPLRRNIHPPFRVHDYRMDVCLGYSIQAGGVQVLVCAEDPSPAGVLFVVAQEPRGYYRRLVEGVRPHTFVPIHWDNFTSSLAKPLRKFARPGRPSLGALSKVAQSIMPGIKVIIPQVFEEYTIFE